MKGKCPSLLIECGIVGRPVGLKGFVAVSWANDQPPVKAGDNICGGAGADDNLPYKILALQKRGRFFAVRFDGVDDRTNAEHLRGKKLFIAASDLPKLPKGEYYSYQILGLDVFTEEGRHLGKVEKIFSAGGHDVYEVCDSKGREILIPAIDSVVLGINIEKKRVDVRLMEGMVN